MGLWGTRRKQPQLSPSQEERLAALEKRLAEVEYEWSGWFDKFRTLNARLAKREQGSNTPVITSPEEINRMIRAGRAQEAMAILAGRNGG